jgi:flagellar motor protein MotB
MSKETLAKLMAIEDINVENRKVQTASFDLKSRTLVLPIWKDDLSEHVTDLLVGHEVAHALYSPEAEWMAVCENKEVPKSYVNILEDIRIEKSIKKKFPGLRKSFVYGYEEMVKDKIHNVFGLDEKITLDGDYKLLIDRINLEYKVGLVKDIPFLEEEEFLLNKISSLESFQDVVDLAKEIFEFSKQKMEDEEEQEEEQSSQGSADSPSEEDESESEQSPESEQSDESEDEETESKSSDQDGEEEIDSDEFEQKFDPLESVTEDLFDSAKDKMIDDSEYDNSYVSYPAKPINHKPFVEDYKDYMSNCGKIVSEFYETWRRHEMEELLNKLAEFKRDSQKTVNYMVKEFEMKKAADAYKRITQSKTGIIDVNKLHSYKYNEDLFRKVSVTPDGKNHGVVMFIDWSGSMAGELFNTMKQVLNLVMFCKKVNIPFEVYSFTDREKDIENWPIVKMNEVQTPKQGQYGIGTQFRLVNLLSSRMNGKEFKKAMELVFINASYEFNWDMKEYALAQTPLNQCIAVSESLLSEFKSSNNLQIVNAIYLTDGENNGITGSFNFVKGNPESHYDSNKVDRFELNRVFGSYNSRASYLVDQKTKKQYTIFQNGSNDRYSRNRYRVETLTLLEILKDRIGVNIIGFHLVNTKRLPRFIDDSLYRMSGGDMEEYYSYSKVEELKRNFRKTLNKNRFYALDEFGYDDYYVLPNNKLDTKTEELVVGSDMKKSEIKRNFIKHNKSKTVNRVLLTRFIEKICS